MKPRSLALLLFSYPSTTHPPFSSPPVSHHCHTHTATHLTPTYLSILHFTAPTPTHTGRPRNSYAHRLVVLPVRRRIKLPHTREGVFQGCYQDAHQPRRNGEHCVWSEVFRGNLLAGPTEDGGQYFTRNTALRRARTQKDSHQSTTCQQAETAHCPEPGVMVHATALQTRKTQLEKTCVSAYWPDVGISLYKEKRQTIKSVVAMEMQREVL